MRVHSCVSTWRYLFRYFKNLRFILARNKVIIFLTPLLRSKYEEIYPPTLEDFVFITDYTYKREQVSYRPKFFFFFFFFTIASLENPLYVWLMNLIFVDHRLRARYPHCSWIQIDSRHVIPLLAQVPPLPHAESHLSAQFGTCKCPSKEYRIYIIYIDCNLLFVVAVCARVDFCRVQIQALFAFGVSFGCCSSRCTCPQRSSCRGTSKLKS